MRSIRRVSLCWKINSEVHGERLKKQVKKLKGLRKALISLCLIVFGIFGYKHWKSSDEYVRRRVIQISTPKGGCTGVEIKAPSGKIFTLTAGHCAEMLVNDSASAKDEDGVEFVIHKLKIDESVDLMLMTPVGNKSIDVADKTYLHEHVRTLTHGAMLPIFRTDGEVLNIIKIDVMKFIINEEHPESDCPKTPWERIEPGLFGDACIMTLNSQLMSAIIIPGSSGGPAVDDDGRLVGIASNTGGGFISGFVPLKDIQAFLKGE